MKICKGCNQKFKECVKIDGVWKNLGGRRYCLVCSPFGNSTGRTLRYKTTYTTKQLELAVKSSQSFSEVLTNLKLNKTGASLKAIKRRIAKGGFDCSHFIKYRPKFHILQNKDWRLILVNNPELKNRIKAELLRKKLIESGRKYRCEICCNIGLWQGKKITLEVNHIDRNWHNNSKDNLRFLCPNCHSQM